MKLIVGLGNPGRSYVYNRHNIGFMCLNYFARTRDIKFDRRQGQARIGLGEVVGSKVVVAKPQTFMNLSGKSVSRLARKFDVSLNNIMVIHDDLDLPLGKIRIRQGGGSGGHRGVDSIITYLEGQDFYRIRVGIGRLVVPHVEIGEIDTIAYVLSDFTSDEKQIITGVIPMISKAVFCLLTEGLAVAMNKYN